MSTIQLRHIAALALALLPVTTVLAEDLEEDDKEWHEVALQLPDAPKQENLLKFYSSGSQTFEIDAKSLIVANDGTVRYTMVATSASGAKNISYEGLRCQSYEVKLYAFGRPDGTWSRSRRNQWTEIANRGANLQHNTLFTEYFCDGHTVAGKLPVLLDRLHGKKSPFR